MKGHAVDPVTQGAAQRNPDEDRERRRPRRPRDDSGQETVRGRAEPARDTGAERTRRATKTRPRRSGDWARDPEHEGDTEWAENKVSGETPRRNGWLGESRAVHHESHSRFAAYSAHEFQ